MTLRFIDFKTSEPQNPPKADKFRRVDPLAQRRRLRLTPSGLPPYTFSYFPHSATFSRGTVPPYRTTTGPTSEFLKPSTFHIWLQSPIQNPKSPIEKPYTIYFLLGPRVFYLQHRVSSIEHRTSSIEYRASSNQTYFLQMLNIIFSNTNFGFWPLDLSLLSVWFRESTASMSSSLEKRSDFLNNWNIG